MKRKIVIVIGIAATILAAAVFYRPIIAWFAGDEVSEGRAGAAARATAGTLTLELVLSPDPPRQRGNALIVRVQDKGGAPVDDAEVGVEYFMPAMGAMAEMKGTADIDERRAGEYRARFDLPMGGSWTLTTRVRSPRGSGEVMHNLTVGQKGLTLVGTASAPSAAPDEVEYYTCPMHPSVKQEQPGKCPICSMDLTPVTKREIESGVVMVDDVRRQKIGVKTAAIDRRTVREDITTVGRVVYDEEKQHDITLKIGGYVEKLLVDETGQQVSKGQLLFQLYSPELYAAQIEYLQAKKTQQALGASEFSDALLRSARRRLELWDLSAKQIDDLEARGTATDRMPFLSPAGGYVIEKHVVEGAKVDAGMTVYRIADLDEIWVEADVYEADLPTIAIGQGATVTLPYVPGKSFAGAVGFIHPNLDKSSRTGRVRVELKNPGLELKPEMYASVALHTAEREMLALPESAVIYTGPRRLVFVDLGEGRLKPVAVKLGGKRDGFFEVLEGLAAGDVVVTSGNFLIAAESRLKGAAEYWAGDAVPAATPAAGPQVPNREKLTTGGHDAER